MYKSRPRLPSSIAAKDHWRENPTLKPQEIHTLFQIPLPRAYRIRNELVREKLINIRTSRTKVKRPRSIVSSPPATPVDVPVIGEPIKADDYQVGGNHYKDMGVPPWDVIEATLTKPEFIGFLKGNIIKYSMRQGVRGEIDSQKCKHYIIKLEEMYRKWCTF
jgi:hypothetical protein